jgi:hypothetical protein
VYVATESHDFFDFVRQSYYPGIFRFGLAGILSLFSDPRSPVSSAVAPITSATSPSSARARPSSAPRTPTRSTEPRVRSARPFATRAPAGPTRTSVSCSGGRQVKNRTTSATIRTGRAADTETADTTG